MTPRPNPCPVERLPQPQCTIPRTLARFIRDNSRCGNPPTVQAMLAAGFCMLEILPALPDPQGQVRT